MQMPFDRCPPIFILRWYSPFKEPLGVSRALNSSLHESARHKESFREARCFILSLQTLSFWLTTTSER